MTSYNPISKSGWGEKSLTDRWVTHSPEETIELGRQLGRCLADNTIVSFVGDLGAGKTTLIKGIAAGVTGCSVDDVSSPTFVYLHVYEGERRLYHFDLYRLEGAEAFIGMGFEDFFHAGGICCVEWADRVAEILPKQTLRLEMRSTGHFEREVTLCKNS